MRTISRRAELAIDVSIPESDLFYLWRKAEVESLPVDDHAACGRSPAGNAETPRAGRNRHRGVRRRKRVGTGALTRLCFDPACSRSPWSLDRQTPRSQSGEASALPEPHA